MPLEHLAAPMSVASAFLVPFTPFLSSDVAAFAAVEMLLALLLPDAEEDPLSAVSMAAADGADAELGSVHQRGH